MAKKSSKKKTVKTKKAVKSQTQRGRVPRVNKDTNTTKAGQARKSDMESAIFQSHDKESVLKTPDRTVRSPRQQQKAEVTSSDVFYSMLGKHDELVDGFPVVYEEGPKALARRNQTGNRVSYFARFDRDGLLYNPEGVFTPPANSTRQKLYGDLRPVPVEVFDLYVNFLKTKNRLYLDKAARTFKAKS